MDKDAKRFDRSHNFHELTTQEIDELLRPLAIGKVASSSLLLGGFANTNYCLKIHEREEKLVLRIPQKNKSEFKKEIALLDFVSAKVPVPRIIAKNFDGEVPFAVLEFIEGRNLSSVLADIDQTSSLVMARDIGRTLAHIHSFDLRSSGFFNEKLEFTWQFDNFGAAYLDHFRAQLKHDYVQKRLGTVLFQRIDKLLKFYEEKITNLAGCTTLLHCDFNPKNLMIDKTHLAAVLDWEYASTGHFLADIGNFLRFEEDYPRGFKEAFLDGYQANGAQLPAEWEAISKILDFAAIGTFLSSQPEKDMPLSAHTAISILENTVHFLGH